MSDKKEKRPKITKDMVPEGFTLSLAIVDAIPVLLFAVAIIILGVKAAFSPLIMLGGFLIFLGGAIKVLGKVIVGIGFLLLIIGCIVSRSALKTAFTGIGVVSIVLFVLWFLCMCLMGVFASKLDSSDPKSNWIEQCTNGVGELCLCLALALL